MNINRNLHYISYLKWPFLIAEVGLIIYSFFVLPENLVSIIGIIIFITGIQMGLESLSDVEKMSLKEQKRFKDNKYVKKKSNIILSSILVLAIISLVFLSLKFVFTSKNTLLYNEFFFLGLNIWALILGLLCLLKSAGDKHNYVNSKIQN